MRLSSTYRPVPREGVILREGAQEWVPLTRQVGDYLVVPVFTSLAGPASAMAVQTYDVTSFAELREQWAGPDLWVAVNLGLPTEACVPFDAVDPLISGEVVLIDGDLVEVDELDELPPMFRAAPERDPDRMLNDPAYRGSRDEYVEALLDARVIVPTTRAVDDTEVLAGPDSPWLLTESADAPTVEVFTSADEFTRAHPGRTSVSVPFLLLMLTWPSGCALFVNPGGRVRMRCSAEEVRTLRQEALAE